MLAREELRIRHDVDSVSVQHAARAFAQRLGFPRREATEIAIVASELSTNAHKYARGGRFVVEEIEDPERGRGVRVTVFDEGPPFADFSLAARDNSDERGPIDPARLAGRRGIGSGLGAVHRFSDACGWDPVEGGTGKRVWAVRWLPRLRPRS